MSLGELISTACIKANRSRQPYASAVIEALTAAGFSIVHKDEIHAPSVERAIAVALAHIQQPGMTDNPAYVHFEPADAMAKKIAAALRELMKEKG